MSSLLRDDEEDMLSEDAFVWALQSAKLADFCSHCLVRRTEQRKLMRCSRCKQMQYCSSECQKKDWTLHGKECKRLTALGASVEDSNFPEDSIRLIARLYEKAGNAEALATTSNGRRYEDLVSHKENISKSGRFEIFLKSYEPFAGNRYDRDRLLEACSKCSVNSFGIKDDRQISIGVGLYLSLSRLDHSCQPNARLVYVGRRVKVVPSKDMVFDRPIDLNSLRHSYIDELQSIDERRRRLQEEYFFFCECEGCGNKKRNGEMEGLGCQQFRCPGAVDEETFTCAKCSSKLTVDEQEMGQMATSLADSAVAALRNRRVSHDTKLQLCQKSIKVADGVLFRANLQRLALFNGAYEACVEMNNWTDAVKYGGEVLWIHLHYRGELDPAVTALQLNVGVAHMNAKQ
uniref:MYND-type domain-containing protein n=1 Tax=Plectus sambesii TaxID=2011161 RepID=A0A914UHU7_9BILA